MGSPLKHTLAGAAAIVVAAFAASPGPAAADVKWTAASVVDVAKKPRKCWHPHRPVRVKCPRVRRDLHPYLRG